MSSKTAAAKGNLASIMPGSPRSAQDLGGDANTSNVAVMEGSNKALTRFVAPAKLCHPSQPKPKGRKAHTTEPLQEKTVLEGSAESDSGQPTG